MPEFIQNNKTFIILAVLAVLLFVIYKIVQKKTTQTNNEELPQESQPLQTSPADADTDDSEIAAIIAAICACTGYQKKQFVIRSIKRHNTSAWKFFN